MLLLALLLRDLCFGQIGDSSSQTDGLGGSTTAPAEPPAQQAGRVDPEKALEAIASGTAKALGPTFEHTSMYGWVGLFVAILLGVVGGRIVAAILTATAARFERRGWRARGGTFRHAAGPANLGLVTVGLFVGFQLIHLEPGMRTFTHKVVALLVISSIGWFLYNLVALVDIIIRRMLRRTDPKLTETVVAMVRKALRIFLLVMVGLFIIQNIFEQNITAWLAGLGIAGLAVSLAAQDPIKNIFGSFTVLAERPFVLGDRVIFNGIDGTVEEIGFRSTRIRTLVGHLVTVPNMKFTDSIIENVSRRPSVRRILNTTIAYDTPPDQVAKAVQILKDILSEPEVADELNLPHEPPRVIFNEFNAESLNIFVIYWYAIHREGRDWWTYQAHTEMVNLKILRAFNDAKIEFAFPTRTLFLAGDPQRSLEIALSRTHVKTST